jgi:hypothetical protein
MTVVRFPAWLERGSSLRRPLHTGCRPHPISYPMDIWSKTDHSPPCSAEIKIRGALSLFLHGTSLSTGQFYVACFECSVCVAVL